jgi:molecular chaperone DnaK
MTIASLSCLSDKDIEKMFADAEQFAETDKARRSLIEEANKADSVCADIEKGTPSIRFLLFVAFEHSL